MANPASDLNYVPHNKSTHAQRHWYSSLPIDFSLKSLSDYYALMRFCGYFFSAMYSGMVRDIERRNPDLKSPDGSGDSIWRKGPTGNFWHAKKIINILEAVVFLGVTTHSYFADRKNFEADFSQAVACEKGMEPNQVKMTDIGNSDNPIIRSVINRHRWSTFMRSLSDVAFGINLKAGLVGKALDITYERSAFIENVAYDILKKAVNEVQSYKLGGYERDYVKKELMRAVQRSLIDDHTTEPLSTEQINKNVKVFDRLTDDIIQNNLGLKEAVYILGRVIKQPDAPERTMFELSRIEEMGMDAYCRAKMGGNMHVPQKRSFTEMARQGSGAAAGLGA